MQSIEAQTGDAFQREEPEWVLADALSRFESHRIAISFSGAEDVVLIDMATKIRRDVQVFTLDTGRLHPETYRLIDTVRERYPIRLEILFPDYATLERLVSQK